MIHSSSLPQGNATTTYSPTIKKESESELELKLLNVTR